MTSNATSQLTGCTALTGVVCCLSVALTPRSLTHSVVALTVLCCCVCCCCSECYLVHVRELSVVRLHSVRATDWQRARLVRSAWCDWMTVQQSVRSAQSAADSFHCLHLCRSSLVHWSSAAARRRVQRSRFVSRANVCLLDRMHAFRTSDWRMEEGTYRMAQEWQKHRTLVTAMCTWWRCIAQQSQSSGAPRSHTAPIDHLPRDNDCMGVG